jgi:hypothetical protein
MRLRLLSIGMAAAFSIGASSAFAVTYERRTTAAGESFILVQGDFAEDDRLQDFVAAVWDHNASFVTFDSPGGDVASAAGAAWFSYGVDVTSMHIVAERSEIVDR